MKLRLTWKILFFALSYQAIADETHPNDMIPGGRAAMMGGAYIAISDDPSGTYYNPGVLAFITKNEFSANATAFFDQSIRYKKALNQQDFVKRSTSNFPSLVGSMYTLGFLKAGYAIITLDSRNTKQNDYFANIADKQNFARNFSRFHHESTNLRLYGSALAVKLGLLGIGISTFYYTYEKETTIHQLVEFSDQNFLNLDQSLTAKAAGVMPVLGIALKFNSFSMGVSGRITRELSDSAQLTQDYVSHENQNSATSDHSESQLISHDFILPDALSLGFAWHPIKSGFTISTSATLYQTKTHKNLSEKDLQKTINYNLGIEFQITSALIWRAGAFTNFDLTKPISSEAINSPDHVDYYGACIGLVYESKDFSSSLGLINQKGSGKAQIVAGISDVQNVSASSTTVLLSLSYYSNK